MAVEGWPGRPGRHGCLPAQAGRERGKMCLMAVPDQKLASTVPLSAPSPRSALLQRPLVCAQRTCDFEHFVCGEQDEPAIGHVLIF